MSTQKHPPKDFVSLLGHPGGPPINYVFVPPEGQKVPKSRAKSSHLLGERAIVFKNVAKTQAPELSCAQNLGERLIFKNK